MKTELLKTELHCGWCQDALGRALKVWLAAEDEQALCLKCAAWAAIGHAPPYLPLALHRSTGRLSFTRAGQRRLVG